MKKLVKVVLFLLKAGLILLLAGLILAELFLELAGFPSALRDLCLRELSGWNITFNASSIKGGPVRGIIARGVTVNCPDVAEYPLVNAEEVRGRFSVSALLRGEFLPRSLSIHNATATLPNLISEEETPVSAVEISGCNGTVFTPSGARTEIVSLDGFLGGIRFSIQGTVKGGNGVIVPVGRARGKPDGDQVVQRSPLRTDSQDRFAAGIRSFLLQKQRLSEKLTAAIPGNPGMPHSGRVQLSFDFDRDNPGRSTAAGSFLFKNIPTDEFSVAEVSSNFQYTPEILIFRDLLLRAERNELTRGTVAFDRGGTSFDCSLKGVITPATLSHFINIPVLSAMPRAPANAPVSFNLTASDSPIDPQKWNAEFSCSTGEFSWNALRIESLNVSGKLARKVVFLEECRVRASQGDKVHSAAGSMTVWLAEKELSGKLGATCYPFRLLDEIGLNLPDFTDGFRTSGSPCTMSLELKRSPFDWHRWKAAGDFSAQALGHGDMVFHAVSAPFSFSPKALRFADIRFRSPSGRHALKSDLTVTADTENLKKLSLAFNTVIDHAVPRQEDSAGSSQSTVSGEALLDTAEHTVSAAATGQAFPAALQEAICESLGMPSLKIIRNISCFGPPARFTLQLPKTAPGFEKWRLNGHAAGENAAYEDLPIQKASADIALTRSGIAFRDIQAVVGKNIGLSLDLEIAFGPVLHLSITDAAVAGNPEFVEHFIGTAAGRRIYRSIWADVSWAEDTPPDISFDLLDLKIDHRRQRWSLQSDIHLSAPDLTYRDLRAQQTELDVLLALPEHVAVRNIRTVVLGTKNVGEAEIRTKAPCRVNFQFRQTDGGCDPRELLGLINPEWPDVLGMLKFSPGSKTECKGEISWASPPEICLKGSIDTPFCVLGKIKGEMLKADWQLVDNRVHWDLDRCGFEGGTLKSTGYYDRQSHSGLVTLNLEDAILKDLAEIQGMIREGSNMQGKVSASCHTQFLRNWSGKDLLFYGDGQFRLKEADLWRVPVLNELGRLLDLTLLSRISLGKLSGLGRISTLEADVELNGERLFVPEFRTDGTIVALHGKGEYDWRNDYLDFQVAGEALRKSGILRWALVPINLMFSADLTGPLQDANWTLSNSIKNVLPSLPQFDQND